MRIIPLLPALAAGLLAACSPSGPSEDPGPVVATLNGGEIHESDLEAWIRDDLYAEATEDKDPGALFEFRSEALDRMIDERLVAAEAASRGLDLAALQREVVGDVHVSDREVETFYEQNRSRMGGASFESVAPRIRAFLTQQTRGQEWGRFVSELRESASVEIAFEPPRADVAAQGPALGPADAPVTIVEFSDFNCPFCQRVNPTLKALRERYPDQVRIVFRHFPLGMHPRARPIAEASVCAAEQDRFWEFHDLVFDDGGPLDDAQIRETAEAAGVELAAFDACLSDGRAEAVVERDMEAARALGVTGTPAFFVNGIPLSGAQPLDAFVRLVDGELAAADGGEDPGAS